MERMKIKHTKQSLVRTLLLIAMAVGGQWALWLLVGAVGVPEVQAICITLFGGMAVWSIPFCYVLRLRRPA